MKNKYTAVVLLLFIYSLVILGYSSYLNIWGNETGFKGYLYSLNWSLYFLFWIPVIGLVKVTWQEFHYSWKSLFKYKIIVTNSKLHEDSLYAKFYEFTKNAKGNLLNRRKIIIYAFILATIVMIVDTYKLVELYNYETRDDVKLYLNPNSKKNKPEYFLDPPKAKLQAHFIKEVSEMNATIDATWTEAWIFKGDDFKAKNAVFVIFAYLQQYIIIFFGWIALLQIWVHLYYFANFDKLAIAKELNMRLELDYRSNLHEFGLERWNQALNTIYWVLSPALVVPIISKNSQSESGLDDLGQIMLRWIVPLLFLSPMIFTIIARQKKVMGIWDKVRVDTDENVQKFHKQVLWPLDKNWASKLGIILSFALLSYLIGDILKAVKI